MRGYLQGSENGRVVTIETTPISGADPGGGGGGGGAHPARAPPKVEKNIKYDFSHEIPQKFSRLPPQLEKI